MKRWPIEKIRSGGQTGVDRAALDWAIKHNVSHGGWCPKGRLAEDGVIDLKYSLQETPTSDYEQRTEWNVRDSDATAIFSIQPELTGGSLWTLSCARKYEKPWIHLTKTSSTIEEASIQLLEFLQRHNIHVLNVAGPRHSEENEAEKFLIEILDQTYQNDIISD
jgi:hypothetical protein